MGKLGLPPEHRAPRCTPGLVWLRGQELGASAPEWVALVSQDIGIHIYRQCKGRRTHNPPVPPEPFAMLQHLQRLLVKAELFACCPQRLP